MEKWKTYLHHNQSSPEAGLGGSVECAAVWWSGGWGFDSCQVGDILLLILIIMKTCLYRFDPLKPHFYILKLRFTGICITSAVLETCRFSPLPPSGRIQQTSWWHFFLILARRHGLIFHANGHHWRQFALNIKIYFLWKMGKIFQWSSVKILPKVLSVNMHLKKKMLAHIKIAFQQIFSHCIFK